MKKWDNCDRNIDKCLLCIYRMHSLGMRVSLLVQPRLYQTHQRCQESVSPTQISVRLKIMRQQHFLNNYKHLIVWNVHDLLLSYINMTAEVCSGVNSRIFFFSLLLLCPFVVFYFSPYFALGFLVIYYSVIFCMLSDICMYMSVFSFYVPSDYLVA